MLGELNFFLNNLFVWKGKQVRELYILNVCMPFIINTSDWLRYDTHNT